MEKMNNVETEFEKESMDISNEDEGPISRCEEITLSLPFGLVEKAKILTEGDRAIDCSIDDLVRYSLYWLFDTNHLYREALGMLPKCRDVLNGPVEVATHLSEECVNMMEVYVKMGFVKDHSAFVRKAVTYYLQMILCSARPV